MLTTRVDGEMDQKDGNNHRRLHVVLYAKDRDALETLRKAVAEVLPDAGIEIYGTVGELEDGLRKLAYNCTVAVIVASDRDELRSMSSLRSFLWGLRTIVVLPDEDDETVSLAHGLRPRFVSTYEGGFPKVLAVLNKMLEDHNSKSIVE